MKKVIIGWDVGTTGSICFLYENESYESFDIPKYTTVTKKAKVKKIGEYKNGKPKYKTITPAKTRKHIDFKELYNMLLLKVVSRDCVVYIEKQGCRPGNSTASCSKTMFNYGRSIQLLECIGVPYNIVSPNEWKKHFGLNGKDYKDNKDIAVEKAKELGFECSVKRADPYEAFLIAKYGMHKDNECL